MVCVVLFVPGKRRETNCEVKGRLSAFGEAPANTRRITADIELFVNEMLKGKNILTGASRKRKASVSRCRFWFQLSIELVF